MPFFPSAATINRFIDENIIQEEPGYISVNSELFKHIIRYCLQSAPFDEAAYLKFNPDLKRACEDGHISNLELHYRETGYFEQRLAVNHEVDYDWYVDFYPDVKLAIETGAVRSAADHYKTSDPNEWRIPNQILRDSITTWRKLLLDL